MSSASFNVSKLHVDIAYVPLLFRICFLLLPQRSVFFLNFWLYGRNELHINTPKCVIYIPLLY